MELSSTLRRVTGAGAALAAAATMLMAPVSASASVTADPSTPFRVVYGATVASGAIRWHQRSVDVDYTFKANYCRRLYAFAYDRKGTERSRNTTKPMVCDDTSSGSWNLPVDVQGGPGWVHLCIADDNDQYVLCKEYKVPA